MKLTEKELVKFLKWANKTVIQAQETFKNRNKNEGYTTYCSDTIGDTNFVFVFDWENGYEEPNPIQLNLSIRIKDTDMFVDAWDFADKGYNTITIEDREIVCKEDLIWLADNVIIAEDIFEQINFKFTKLNKTTEKWNECHTLFRCSIKYKGKSFSCEYQCNVEACGNPTLNEYLGCLIADSEAFDYSGSLEDFCNEFGYDLEDNRKQCEKIYYGCGKERDGIHNIFDNEEFELIKEYLQNKGWC